MSLLWSRIRDHRRRNLQSMLSANLQSLLRPRENCQYRKNESSAVKSLSQMFNNDNGNRKMTQQKQGFDFKNEAAMNLITGYGPLIMALFISVVGTRPIWGLVLFACGFLLFFSAKVMNFRRGAWISFGSSSMQKGQRWVYRAGYALMILGFFGILAAAAFTRMFSR